VVLQLVARYSMLSPQVAPERPLSSIVEGAQVVVVLAPESWHLAALKPRHSRRFKGSKGLADKLVP
jgi:hypothetical protein